MESVATCTSFISSRSQRFFRSLFQILGRKLYLYYCWFIILGLFITLLCTAGGIAYVIYECDNLEMSQGDIDCEENRSFYLWIPRDSIVWSHYTEIIDVFGSYPSRMSLLLSSGDGLENSIISPENLDVAYDVFASIDDIILKNHVEGSNRTYQFEDVCLRVPPTSPYCESTPNNFFGAYFMEDENNWNTSAQVEATLNFNPTSLGYFLGGFEVDSDTGDVIGASSMRFIYELEGSTNETVQDIVYEYMGTWQDYWEEHASDYDEEEISVSYYSDRSFDDEISRVVSGDLVIYVLALMVMLIYLMFTLGKISCIGARPWLAFSAILVMICALAMGFSIAAMTGTTFNTIVMLVPYILLGVGVDDMIILVDTYDKTPMPDDDILNAHIRLGNALASSGLSISLTSFCSSMAFFVGSATDIPGIESFCLYAAWSFLANYVLQFLLFVPLMVIDDKRIRNKKNFCFPCCVSHDKKLQHKSQINFFDPEKMVKNNGAISSTKYKSDGANLNKQSSSIKLTTEKRCVDKCNAEYLMKITLIPLLNKRIFRLIIIFLFICSLVGSIYVIPEINTVSDATKLVPDDSYVIGFIDKINEIYTGTVVDELQIVIQDKDFSDTAVRNNIIAMMRDMENQTDSLSNVDNWLESFEIWYIANSGESQGLAVFEGNVSGFYHTLQEYADPTSVYHYEIIYDDIDNPTKIEHTRFTMRVVKSGSVTGQYPQYIAWNAIFNEYLASDTDGYAFIPEYCFAYLSQSIVGLTVDNMVFAGIGVFGVLILLLDLRLAFFIMVIVAMIDVNLFGWMWLLDISLDTLSYSQCVMAVGLTVDYVIHITHAIAEAKPEFDINYDLDSHNEIYYEKLKIALSEMGASVVKGAFTTFIGALALIFSQSQAFRIFFYMFSGIITIAVAHGIILAPAIMGEIRFIYAGIDEEEDPISSSARTKVKTNTPNDTLANLTLAQSVGNSNASDFADREDYASPSPRQNKPSTKSKRDLSPIMAHGGQLSGHNDNGIVDNLGQRTPHDDEKRKSIQMTNYQSDDSNDSSKDQFEE